MEFQLPNTSIHFLESELKNKWIKIKSQIDNPQDHDLTKRKISSEIDLFLGFKIKIIEEKLKTKALQIAPETQFNEWGPILHKGAQTWLGLDFQILQTSYHDFKILFESIKPKPNQIIIDLGAGYGRMGIFLSLYYPKNYFLGIELVQERVDEANRIYQNFNLKNQMMISSNLNELIEIPDGDIYFIYDFGSKDHIKKILLLLKEKTGKVLIVKGHICQNIITHELDWDEGLKIKRTDDMYLYYL